jgi:hypothetical protein
MKLLLVILSFGFLSQARASVMSREFKQLPLSEQRQIISAINDIQYYSEHQAVVGGIKIRSQALNLLRSKMNELTNEAGYSIYSSFSSELDLAKSKLMRMIKLHNLALLKNNQAAIELTKEAASLDSFKLTLTQD